MKFNETWQEARSLRPLPSLCFSGDRKNKMAPLASDWLSIFYFSSKTTIGNSTRVDRKQDLNVLYQVCVFWVGRNDGRPGLWLDETFLTSLLKPLNRIQRNFTRSKILMSSTKFVFWGLIRKTRWTPRPLIGQTFWTSPLKPLKRIQWNLTESMI